MNIIKTTSYEGDYICSICRDNFTETDKIYLVKHLNNQTNKSERIDKCRGRKHIFHANCLSQNISYASKAHHEDHPEDPNDCDHLCPLDREPICELIEVKYSEVVTLNILNFSHNYYELLTKTDNRDISNVSITDKINLNYKDINGKTLLYCVCQRGDLKLLRKLVTLGGDPTICDDQGFSPLMAASSHGFVDLVKYLIKIDKVVSSINYTDEKGLTAFDYADRYQKYACLSELLLVTGVKIDHHILKKLYMKYQSFRRLGYETVTQKIRDRLQKLLNIKVSLPDLTSNQRKVKFDCCDTRSSTDRAVSSTDRAVSSTDRAVQGTNPVVLEDDEDTFETSDFIVATSVTKIINIDPDKYPTLFNQIYQPRDLGNMSGSAREIY
jgi:hypothetical protein